MQFEHRSGFVVSSPHPLPRVAGQEEVANTGEEPMPDIYPVSPFVSVLPPRKRYSAQDQYGMFHLTPVGYFFSDGLFILGISYPHHFSNVTGKDKFSYLIQSYSPLRSFSARPVPTHSDHTQQYPSSPLHLWRLYRHDPHVCLFSCWGFCQDARQGQLLIYRLYNHR